MKLNTTTLWIDSAVLSFLAVSLIQYRMGEDLPISNLCLASSIVCVVFGVIAAIIYRSHWFTNGMKRIFHVSLIDGVLQNAIDYQKGTSATIVLKDTREIYYGSVVSVSDPRDTDQWICISSPVRLTEGGELLWPKGGQAASHNHKMVFHLSDILTIDFVSNP